jgi:hypothetical protein
LFSVGFINTINNSTAQAGNKFRNVVTDGVVNTTVQLIDGAVGLTVNTLAIDPSIRSASVGVQEGAQLTHTYLTESALQTNEGVTGSKGVAVAVTRSRASGTVDVQALLNLPDGFQAIAQIFVTLETDQGTSVVDAGNSFGLPVLQQP